MQYTSFTMLIYQPPHRSVPTTHLDSMMSAVEAHPRPARPSAPPTAMAMVKDKRGKALNKASGGFSVDLESVDFGK